MTVVKENILLHSFLLKKVLKKQEKVIVILMPRLKGWRGVMGRLRTIWAFGGRFKVAEHS